MSVDEAIALYNNGEIEAAEHAFRQIPGANNRVLAAEYFAACLYQLGKYEEALTCYENLLKKLSSTRGEYYEVFLLNAARCLNWLDRYDEARQNVELILAQNPNHFGAHMVMGDVNFNDERWGAAEKAYTRATFLEPENPKPLIALGQVFFRREEYGRSLETCIEALDLDPDNVELLFDKADAALRAGGLLDVAIDTYEAILSIDPRESRAHFGLGSVYYSRGNFMHARECFEAAIDGDEHYTKAHYQLGLTQMHLRNHNGAEESLRRVCQLDPKHVMARVDLSLCLSLRDNYTEAVNLAREAIKLDPENALAWRYLGRAYMGLGEYVKADDALLESMGLKGDVPDTLLELGQCCAQQGYYIRAKDYLEQGLALVEDDEDPDVDMICAFKSELEDLSRLGPSDAKDAGKKSDIDTDDGPGLQAV